MKRKPFSNYLLFIFFCVVILFYNQLVKQMFKSLGVLLLVTVDVVNGDCFSRRVGNVLVNVSRGFITKYSVNIDSFFFA